MSCLELISDIVVFVVVVVFIVFTVNSSGIKSHKICAQAEIKNFTKSPKNQFILSNKNHYCLTDLTVDSNDITVLVSGEQKHYFHLWGLQKPLVAFATRDFFRPHS
jgi:hypothetical protein